MSARSLAPHLEATLQAALSPVHVEVVDESHLHAGHAGARSGGGHYRVLVVSEAFAGKAPLARHRLVNALFAEELRHAIHALALTTMTPDEWSASTK
jgi:BolA family transcriptional regulator, general stress-responsive regulator